MKQNFKQLLKEEVDSKNCEELYEQTIKITLSTEDILVYPSLHLHSLDQTIHAVVMGFANPVIKCYSYPP